MLDLANIFSNFSAFCNSHMSQHMANTSICEALKVCRKNINIAIKGWRLFIFCTGMNWKSHFQEMQWDQRLANIPKWVAIELSSGAEYPPQGQWVAETNKIFCKWCTHFASHKMHDKRTARLPVCQLDLDKLMHDIHPGASAIFMDDGEFCISLT